VSRSRVGVYLHYDLYPVLENSSGAIGFSQLLRSFDSVPRRLVKQHTGSAQSDTIRNWQLGRVVCKYTHQRLPLSRSPRNPPLTLPPLTFDSQKAIRSGRIHVNGEGSNPSVVNLFVYFTSVFILFIKIT
jgi:hypothetical protein